MQQQTWYEPERVFEEYRKGRQFKAGLGARGLYEQNKMNERFFLGDQWHGAKCGDEKPLMRYNVLKRIGDYKMAVVGGSGVAVNYSAEGVPNTQDMQERVRERMQALRDAQPEDMDTADLSAGERINMVMKAMCDYFKVTAERVKLDDIKNRALRKAYITGTGIVHTYWDERVRTGLYADAEYQSPVMGDIRCEVLDVENVYFGDPNLDDVQEQPYILLAQRKSVEEIKRCARRNKRPAHVVESIKPDRDTQYMAGDRAEEEPGDAKKATVITKMYKEWDEEGKTYVLKAVEVVEGAVIRGPWDMKIRMYPIARLPWESLSNCAYGDSELTHLIPNQITINRTIVAATQALILHGMPIMLVDGDVVTGPVSNEPGQVIRVYGAGAGVSGAIGFARQPTFSPQFDNMVNSLMINTMTQSGANEAALGDMNPDNASAIVAMREAATRPMQLLQNRFYSFIEDIARIWAEFWVSMYGKRALKIEDATGSWYMPFDGAEYRDLLISVRVDVGQAGLWSEIQTQRTLDNMLGAGLITPVQYLERLPKGAVPDQGGLLRDYKQRAAAQTEEQPPQPTEEQPPEAQATQPEASMPPASDMGEISLETIARQLPPEYAAKFSAMSEEQKQQVAAMMLNNRVAP